MWCELLCHLLRRHVDVLGHHLLKCKLVCRNSVWRRLLCNLLWCHLKRSNLLRSNLLRSNLLGRGLHRQLLHHLLRCDLLCLLHVRRHLLVIHFHHDLRSKLGQLSQLPLRLHSFRRQLRNLCHLSLT